MFIDFRSTNSGGSGDAYSKAETDELLAKKANSTELTEEKGRAEQAEEVLDGKIVANTEAIQNKADKSTTYTKDEVDSALSSKADASDIADIDSKLQSKADSSDVNAIAESLSTTQEIVAQKANIGDSYTKAESDSKFLTEHQSLAEYAKTADVAEAYQPKGDYITSETDPIYTADKPNIALKSEIPSLDGYATEQWVENKNYITGYTESDPVWNAEKTNYYNKTQVDAKLYNKADASTVYTKSQVDSALSNKANSSDVYTKNQVNIELAKKANTATTYTKSEVDSKVADMPLKTINGESIKGTGNIVIQGGSGDAYTKAESDALLANKTNTNLDNISDEGKENLKNIIKGSKTNLWNAGELSHTITAEEAALKWEIGLDAEVFQMWENFSFYTQSSWEIQYSPGKSDNITFSCTGSTNGITIYDKATDTKLSTDADMYLQVPLDSYYIKFDEGLDMATNYFDYVEGVFYSGTEPLLDVYTKSEIKENYYNKNDIDNKGFVTQYYVTSNYSSSTQVNTALNKKANTSLDNVSLKTINGESIKGSGDITIKGGDEHFQFNPEQDIVNGIAVYTKDEKLITIDNKNEPIPMGTAFKFDMNSIDETKYLADSMYFWTYTFNASEEKLTIHREMMYYEPNPLNIYKDGELVAKIGSTEEGGVSMYEISFSELSHYTFKPMCTVVDNWHFDDYSNETIPFVKPTLILGGDSEGAYVVRNSIKKEIATTDNYAELTFVDVDGNETTLLLLKKN